MAWWWLVACARGPGAPVVEGPSVEITAAELQAHVEVLASDAYQGREALTPGRAKAAEYLTSQLEMLPVERLSGHEDFTVDFPLWRKGWSSSSSLQLRGTPFVAGRDLRPFPFSAPAELEDVEVVFAGYGIVADELGWDDYAGLDVTDKLVLVLRHEPGENDAESPFDGTESSTHALFTTKAQRIAERGGAGMLLVTDPLHHEGPEDLRLGARLTLTPPDAVEPPAADALPAAQVSLRLAEALLGGELAQVQRALDEGQAPASLELEPNRVSLRLVAGEAEEVAGTNVLAVLTGSELPDEWVVIGAHYDHEGAFTGSGDTVFNGADDNASGTAMVLELAQALSADPPARTVLFAFFDAEEKGLLGSKGLLLNEQVPVDNIVAMVNLDMLGRNPDRPVDVMGDGYATGLREVVDAAAEGTGLEYALQGTTYKGNSDHHPFFRRGVPIVNFFTGLHEDYHQLGDQAEKLDFQRMETIGRVTQGVVEELVSGRYTPHFVHRVTWLGVAVEQVGGEVRVTGVEEPSRAAEAGLVVGDTLLAVGEAEQDLPQALQQATPGAPITLRLAERELTVERARTGYLGVFPAPLGAEQRTELSLPPQSGLVLAQVVADGPAGTAGLVSGDVVWMIDGVRVGLTDLGVQLSRIGAGETVRFDIVRDGERQAVDVALGERPQR